VIDDKIAEAKSIDADLFRYYNKVLGYTEDETADILITMRRTRCI